VLSDLKRCHPEPAVAPALVVMFARPMIMNHLGRDLRETSVNRECMETSN
jgi:hypothetical protein